MHCLWIRRINAVHLLIELTRIDRDAARVLLDRTDDARTQPRDMREQALMRGLAQGEVQAHVVSVNTNARTEFGDIAWEQSRY